MAYNVPKCHYSRIVSCRRNHSAGRRPAGGSSKSARGSLKSGVVRAAQIITVSALLTFTACSRSTPRETEAEPAIPVLAEPVRLGTIRASISATGVVGTLPGAAFTVVATQPARIAEITRNVGDPVKSGEILVHFEFPSLRTQTAVDEAAAKAAELRVKQAQLAQGRIQALVAQGAASRSELDEADRQLTAAEGDYAIAKAALSAVEAQGRNTAIRAPFDGIVTERMHNPGDNVRAADDDPILRLIDPKQVQVMVTLPVADTARFVVGATARAIAEGFATTRAVEGGDSACSGERREDRRHYARIRHADRTAARHAGRRRNRRRTAVQRSPRPGHGGAP